MHNFNTYEIFFIDQFQHDVDIMTFYADIAAASSKNENIPTPKQNTTNV